MPLYFSIDSIPELAPFSKQRRRQIWNECRPKSPGRLFYLGAFTAVGPGFGAIFMLSLALRWNELVGMGLAFGWLIFCIMLGTHLVIQNSIPGLRQKIGGFCPRCGYDIRMTPERCPECGTTPDEDFITP